jgi:hypothetical protein
VERRAHPAARTVSPLRQSLLDLADGVRTPAAIARALGRPAFNTLIEVRRLAADGLIETPEKSALPSRPAASSAAEATEPPSVLDSAMLRRLRDALEATL